MTILSVKRDLQQLFVLEVSNDETIQNILESICKQASCHKRVETLCSEVKLLAEKGPFHISETENESGRYGNSLEPDMIDFLLSKSQEVSDKLKMNKMISIEEYSEMITLLKQCVDEAYPEGLLENDPINRLVETSDDRDKFEPHLYEIWWAGKKLNPELVLSEYSGRNEKTKLVVKLQRKGSGPPSKENPLDEQGQKNMMAYYYKRQEVEKQLAKDRDVNYFRASWADSNSLKKDFQGLSDITWKPR